MKNLVKIIYNDKIKSNYLYLPFELTKYLSDNNNMIIINITKNLENHYFTSFASHSSNQNTIEISPKLAKQIKFSNGEYVKISIENKDNYNYIDNIILEPITNYDYKLIEDNSSFFEENLLNQIIVVYDGLIFPFIFYDNKIVYVKVKSEIKNKPLILSQDSQVEVIYVPEDKQIEKSISFLKISSKVKFVNNQNSLCVRIPRTLIEGKIKDLNNYLCNISIRIPKDFNILNSRLCDESNIIKFSKIIKSEDTNQDKRFNIENNIFNKSPYRTNLWVNLIIDETLEENDIVINNDMIHDLLFLDNDEVNLIIFDKDDLNQLDNDVYSNFLKENLQLEYFTDESIDDINVLKSLFKGKNNNVLLNYDLIYDIKLDNRYFLIRISFKCEVSKYYELLNRLKINFNRYIESKEIPIIEPFVFIRDEEIIKNYIFTNELNIIRSYNKRLKMNRYFIHDKYESDMFQKINDSIIESELKNNNIIKTLENFYTNKHSQDISFIITPKEYTINNFIERMSLYLSDVHLVMINLNVFRIINYDMLEIAENYLKSLFKFYLSFDRKYFFIIQGLECFKKVEGMADKFKDDVNISISYILKKYVKIFHKRNIQLGNSFYFMFLLQGVSSVDDYIFHNLLYDLYKVNYIRKDDSRIILQEILTHNNLIYDVDELNEYCNNFVLSDFIKINKNIRNNTSNIVEYFNKYLPINLTEDKIIRLNNDFSSIGGMCKAKLDINDTIVLSTECEKIFKNKLPIKLSSGILLIGPSGCGKTLIASSIQKQFKINFYSVKGPEILNKYIGASEAAIREIFENAKKTIPCIIFFDEFDSIAPKRGSGSSGVTDRIVNQLLTYLDGIESRNGIFVIAASSRPDLIDPAVIRPGRLDKIILCDFPNLEERTEILKLYYNKSINHSFMSKEVESTLKGLAVKCEYFTGADLQSLIYNSFLIAVKRNISMELNEAPIITSLDLNTAFDEFKRSMSQKDINFQEEIKKKFILRISNSIDDENKNVSLKTTLY